MEILVCKLFLSSVIFSMSIYCHKDILAIHYSTGFKIFLLHQKAAYKHWVVEIKIILGDNVLVLMLQYLQYLTRIFFFPLAKV